MEIIGDPAEASLQPVALRAGPSGLGPVSVSRDGYYLAYDGPANNKVVLDLRSGASVTVDRGGVVEWSPAAPQFLLWSPYDSEPDVSPIDLVDAADGRAQRLVATGLWPALSPDGRQVAYWRPEAEGYSLWLVSIEGGEEIRLTQPAPWNQLGGPPLPFSYESTPQWSPDGRFLAFIALRDDVPEAHVLDLVPEG